MASSAIVVGAGINGLLIARELLERGWKVQVLDRGSVPNALSASHGRHRLIHPWASGENGRAQDAHLAVELWHELLHEISFDGFVQTGVMVANLDAASSVRSRRYSPESESISYDETCRLMPQLVGGSFYDATLYPQFGCLLADQILCTICEYLKKRGVDLLSHHAVRRIDARAGKVELQSGDVFQSDLIVVAAGTGTSGLGGLFDDTGITFDAKCMRCYVFYFDPGASQVDLGPLCWISLGSGDLWGMPAVRGIPAKLGCGQLTHESDPVLAEEDVGNIRSQVVSEYAKLYPKFSALVGGQIRFNHWTQFSTTAQYHVSKRLIVITACSGGGFKFAPLTAKRICMAEID